MDSLQAFALGEANRGKELMVFDWNKAAKLIKEMKLQVVCAGLRDDWEWTGGCIYRDGGIVKNDYTYLASTWAVPEIDLDGEIFECYKMQSEVPEWDARTKWANSAIEIMQN